MARKKAIVSMKILSMMDKACSVEDLEKLRDAVYADSTLDDKTRENIIIDGMCNASLARAKGKVQP
jgi:hypothetical protein